MRFTCPQGLRLRISVSIVVASLLVALLFDSQDTRSHRQRPSHQHDAPAQDVARQPADLVSLMQGAKVHVDYLGALDKSQSDRQTYQESEKLSKDVVDDTSFFSGVPKTHSSPKKTHSLPKTKFSRVSMVSMSGSQGLTGQAAAEVGEAVAGLHTALYEAMVFRFVDVQSLASTGGIAVMMLVLLIGCTCIAAGSIVFPQWFGLDARRGASPSGPQVTKEMLEQRGSMFTQAPTLGTSPDGITSTPLRYSRLPGSQRNVVQQDERSYIAAVASPLTNALMPTPRETGVERPASSSIVAAPRGDAPRPPALCPTLVMPVCEARFGIPMLELAQLQSEGELNIVGLSGNPLLRAVVRKQGSSRMLEISMPEQNSAPRATITPSALEYTGATQGSRALEIRGMRGAFYGILEMRSSGACYVVKDGQSVLSIDGDADSLQLAIKSSIGLPLASVRCSTEPFGGVDHVEIRVEPGVDTVLVLAVVLAILLLSPYLPPPEAA